jgi:hypothetical protein
VEEFLSLVAAFAGGVIGCSFLPAYGLVAVLAGLFVHVATGYYLSTVVVIYFKLPAEIQPGLAFVMAVGARSLLGGLLRITSRFGRAPPKFW